MFKIPKTCSQITKCIIFLSNLKKFILSKHVHDFKNKLLEIKKYVHGGKNVHEIEKC